MKPTTKLLILVIANNISHASVIFGVKNINKNIKKYPVYVQMGSFSNYNNAANYLNSLKTSTNTKTSINHINGHHQVRVGPFNDYQSLRQFKSNQNHGVNRNVKKTIINKVSISKKQPAVTSPSLVIDKLKSPQWFINGKIGGQVTSINSSAAVNNGSGLASPYNKDIYTTQNPNLQTLFGAQIGRRWDINNKWLTAIAIGAQYEHFFMYNINGSVTQYSLPEFKNYDYKWPVSSDVYLANAKVNLFEYHNASPYLNGAVGASYNNSGHYSEKAYIGVTQRTSPNFSTNSATQFAYILGAGLDYKLNKSIIAGIGYQYTNLGKLNSGNGTQSWSNEKLSFGNNQSNSFLFELTYLFDSNNQKLYK
jgi:opacity protein-like surface antigen